MGQKNACQIGIEAYGDASALRMFEQEVPPPAPGEVQIRQSAVGVNFVDIYFRSGLHRLPQLPGVLGVEAAGVVAALGAGVSGWQVGERVAYAGLPSGSYTNLRNVPAQSLVRLPSAVSEETAAAYCAARPATCCCTVCGRPNQVTRCWCMPLPVAWA
jgi:NADPH2:quinone reductase